MSPPARMTSACPNCSAAFTATDPRAIVAYPVACIPQSWAAAAPFMLLQALLGISAHASENTLTVDRPRLPDWLGAVEIRDLRIGHSTVSLAFRYSASGSTGFSLLEQQGNVRVTMSA